MNPGKLEKYNLKLLKFFEKLFAQGTYRRVRNTSTVQTIIMPNR